MPPPDFSQIGSFLIAALVVFTVYRRFRRNFGRQLLRPVRMMVRVALLVVLGCSLMPLSLRSAQFLTGELTGAAFGIGLGVFGAQRTRFLRVGTRLHYVPHTYTGIAVSMLFLGRLVYRLIQIYTGGPPTQGAAAAHTGQVFAPASMVQSPLTVAVFFVLVGYYACYYGLVLWKSKQLKAQDMEVVSAPTTP